MCGFRVVELPDVVFEDIVISFSGVRVGDFRDKAEVVFKDVVMVDEERHLRMDVDVQTVGVQPVSLGNG